MCVASRAVSFLLHHLDTRDLVRGKDASRVSERLYPAIACQSAIFIKVDRAILILEKRALIGLFREWREKKGGENPTLRTRSKLVKRVSWSPHLRSESDRRSGFSMQSEEKFAKERFEFWIFRDRRPAHGR